MNTNVYIKLLSGPLADLTVDRQEPLTRKPAEAVDQIIRALATAAIHWGRDDLNVRLRSFGRSLPFSDAVLAGPDGVSGYAIFGVVPRRFFEADVQCSLLIDQAPFAAFEEHRSARRLLAGVKFPVRPDLPPPITVTWSGKDGIVSSTADPVRR